jgi:hypothetical protein
VFYPLGRADGRQGDDSICMANLLGQTGKGTYQLLPDAVKATFRLGDTRVGIANDVRMPWIFGLKFGNEVLYSIHGRRCLILMNDR